MNIWVERLADADDDYLIGLSNKGIVKRAYKDKEETAAEVVSVGEEAVLKLGSETVTVRFPLGESKCTCPSRSMCRHVVLGILAQKEYCREAGAGGEEQGRTGTLENTGAGQGADLPENAISGHDTPTGNDIPNQKAVPEQNQIHPLEKLKKVLGSRGFASFANQACADIRPKIHYSSVITVQLPERDYTVKLLSPLAYSSCTCHKKEICVHKAAAILWCQLETKTLTKEHLLGEEQEIQNYDL